MWTWRREGGRKIEVLTFAITAMHLEARRPLLSILVVIMPNLQDETKLLRPSIFSLSGASSRFLTL